MMFTVLRLKRVMMAIWGRALHDPIYAYCYRWIDAFFEGGEFPDPAELSSVQADVAQEILEPFAGLRGLEFLVLRGVWKGEKRDE